MNKEKLVIWFSCGAASAVTVKLCLARYARTYQIVVVRCVVANEHQDNNRFADACEKWFDVPVLNIRSEEYADCWDVWTKKRFLVGPKGAPCSLELKKKVRLAFECDWQPGIQAYGYTVEEQERASRFRKNNPDLILLTPLIDAQLSKADCLAMIQRAGIELPAMYKLGFNNNNCVGCVKGGMGYWNRVRKYFPETFQRMSQLERDLGAAIIHQKGKRIYLDELPLKAGRHKEPEIDCSLPCYEAEQEIAQ